MDGLKKLISTSEIQKKKNNIIHWLTVHLKLSLMQEEIYVNILTIAAKM